MLMFYIILWIFNKNNLFFYVNFLHNVFKLIIFLTLLYFYIIIIHDIFFIEIYFSFHVKF